MHPLAVGQLDDGREQEVGADQAERRGQGVGVLVGDERRQGPRLVDEDPAVMKECDVVGSVMTGEPAMSQACSAWMASWIDSVRWADSTWRFSTIRPL